MIVLADEDILKILQPWFPWESVYKFYPRRFVEPVLYLQLIVFGWHLFYSFEMHSYSIWETSFAWPFRGDLTYMHRLAHVASDMPAAIE